MNAYSIGLIKDVSYGTEADDVLDQIFTEINDAFKLLYPAGFTQIDFES